MSSPAALKSTSSILAVVTHFGCERWLDQCIHSLVSQTRPADGVIVVDDHSDQPPVDIVRKYPTVSLWVSAENSGPYQLMQNVVDSTDYDAYMFQDADDWSTSNRLQITLTEAERSQAEMVGSQVHDVFCDIKPERAVEYQWDVRAAVLANPTIHPILLPTSIVSRSLIRRVGGFATGLRFGGDSEFIRRAVFAGKIVNVPQKCYHRRIHPASATRRPDTGFGSPLRNSLAVRLQSRARSNVAKVIAGQEPDLYPLEIAPPIELTPLIGPPIRMANCY